MISRIDLERLNGVMLGRGAPTEKDDFGYNVPDYNKLSSIWFGATNKDLYEISSRLLKYYDTQLSSINTVDFTKEELIEVIEYYKELVDSEISRDSVTVALIEDFKIVYVGFKYNEDYINVMRSYQFTFDRDIKSWFGDSSYAKSMLGKLEDLGADVKNALVFLENIEREENVTFSKEFKTETKNGNIIRVEEVDEDNISLKFDFDNELINEIKQLKVRRFDWDDKVWIINKFEAKALYENIQYMDYDLSELKPYLDDVSLPRLKLIKLEGTDLEFSFPYLPDVVEAIKKLSFYKFNRSKDKDNKDKVSWTIDVREKDLLIDLVGDIVDCSEIGSIVIEQTPTVPLKDYSYLKRKPYAHQIEAAKFLLDKRKSLLADEMGTGKTFSTIMASFSLPSPRLVICPASLKLNWEREIRMVDYEGSIGIVGDKEVDYSSDWIVINYDILEREYNNLKDILFTSVTIDECHYIKSVTNGGKPDSKRANYTMKLASKCDYVFSLTGTPINNKPKDIYNILKISDHILSKNFFNFAKRYCGAEHNGWGWSFEGAANEYELHEKLKPIMLRRLKKDMLELPNKIRRFIPVQINMRAYNEAVNEYMDKKHTFDSEGEHLAYLGAIKHILAREKVDNTIEFVENILESDESVVVFTNYNAVVDRLMAKFGDKITKLTGSCSSNDRQKAVDDFQAGKKKILVANIKAGGVGITLVKANNLIFNDFDWVPSSHFQAEDRIHRIGQTRNCTIDYIYVNGAEIDDYMANMLEEKSTYINKIVDGGGGDQLNIVSEVIKNLYNKVL